MMKEMINTTGSRHAAKVAMKKLTGSHRSSNLRLVYSPDSTDDLISRANAHLAARQPYQALQTYTKILHANSPGHPCALLNRSLAYIAVGYPELAVADAYRAAMASYGMRQPNTISSDKRLKAVARYTRAERLANQSGEAWATESTCYIGQGWLGVPLAAIFLNADQVTTEKSQRQSVCMVLELKAIYRMAYALWRCGRGALSDALGLLSDAKMVYKLTSQEEFCFLALGNEMMLEIEEEITKEEMGSRTTVEGGLFNGQFEDTGKSDLSRIRGLMRRRYTMVKREVYPWNKHEPALGDPSVLRALNNDVRDLLHGCEVRVLYPLEEKMPELALFATKAIQPGDLVLTEGSSLQVTTASAPQTANIYCNVCAALIIAPAKFADLTTGQNLRSSNLGGHSDGSSPTHKNTSDGDEADVAYFSQKQEDNSGIALTQPKSGILGTPPNPPPHQQPPAPDLQACSDCSKVFFCSSQCKDDAKKEHHPSLCGKGIEDGIREAIQKHECLAHHTVNPKAEQIYELLLVRILALAKEKDVHPLDLDEVQWLNADFYATPHLDNDVQLDDTGEPLDFCFSPFSRKQGDSTQKTLPWSFEANVVRPFKWLTKMGLKPIENLEKYDGWVINTLLAKIMASTRIAKGSRHTKVYDVSGRRATGLEAALGQSSEEDPDVWAGNIHPIFSHVQTANDQSDANVVFKDEGMVSCNATEDGERVDDWSYGDDKSVHVGDGLKGHTHVWSQERQTKPCIKAGTLILRLSELVPTLHTQPASGGDIHAWVGNVRDDHGDIENDAKEGRGLDVDMADA